ncbi:zf-HC2 domain-containing protein [Paenibacillus sp. N3.4]|uniref:zf-HC2 domain-containing protein n=1 Tax=Paenibacillus sp. N3.4 TaxID=2603222 RepID=UPI0011CBDC7C|nr:zf-HC2 domain-containing protein [Paenibacillus sp. N3.4]TXK84073.1 hypothetical protein FU659_10535 [Paenibacillus sp. N3.4]
MNCQEVMEFMHRQLDGDLDAQEEDELHVHLMNCLDCAQMFERLQRLSEELTQLPKVVPPYSLVDAIMPQLADLDRQAAASITESTAVLSKNASQITLEQPPKLPWTRRFGSQFSWKFAGGVVAAGLILGFFAFNLQHPVLDQADGLLQPKTKSGAPSAAESQSVGQDRNSSQTADQKKMAMNADTPSATAPAASSEPAKKDEHSPKAAGASAPQATTDAKLEKPQPLATDSLKSSESARESQQSNAVPTKPEPLRDQSSFGAGEQKIAPPSLTDPVPQVGSSDQGTEGSKLKAATGNEATPSPVTRKSDPNASSSDMNSFALVAPTVDRSMVSVTGAYEAVVEEQHVVIRNVSTKEIIFASKQIGSPADNIRLVEWSKEDKFSYEIVSGDAKRSFTVDVKAKKESSP